MPVHAVAQHRAIIDVIEELERRRRDASVSEDFATLADLLDDDVTYIHSTGVMQNKAEYLSYLAERVRTLDAVRPEPLAYQVLPDVVISTGRMEQRVQRRADDSTVDVRALVTQIWVRRGTGWKLLHLHSTRLPE